jgi:hypothetical protein
MPRKGPNVPVANDLAVPSALSSGRSGDTSNRGELECLCIKTAENGFSCEARFEPKKPPSSKNDLPYPESELSVFEALPNLIKYVTKMLTDQADYEKKEK